MVGDMVGECDGGQVSQYSHASTTVCTVFWSWGR